MLLDINPTVSPPNLAIPVSLSAANLIDGVFWSPLATVTYPPNSVAEPEGCINNLLVVPFVSFACMLEFPSVNPKCNALFFTVLSTIKISCVGVLAEADTCRRFLVISTFDAFPLLPV